MCTDFPGGFFRFSPKHSGGWEAIPFLLQGYYNYRHLLLSHTKERKIYIGIPGQYHRRDKYLADMFGFGRFKGIHNKQIRLGDFGYWMMEFDILSADGRRNVLLIKRETGFKFAPLSRLWFNNRKKELPAPA